MVRCNDCNRDFPLVAGKIVGGKQRDSLSRQIHYSAEHEWALPDPVAEAEGLLRLFESGNSDVAEIRNLISVTDAERRGLEFLEARGMIRSGTVERIIGFREKVLFEF